MGVRVARAAGAPLWLETPVLAAALLMVVVSSRTIRGDGILPCIPPRPP